MAIPTSAIVNHSNLFTQPHANIFNLINNRANVPDPEDSLGTRRLLYVREPRDLSTTFSGFPVIVIPPIELSEDIVTVDGNKATVTFSIMIRIMTKDHNIPRAGTASGAEALNSLSDNVLKTLNKESNRNTLRSQGMSNIKIISTPTTYEETHDHMMFVREIEVRFSPMLKVVA